MSSDATSREPAPPKVDRRKLPQIKRVEVVRVRYGIPLRRYTGPNTTADYDDVVEIRVQLSEPIPIRAEPPVLYVGDLLVRDFQTEGPTSYRFFVLEPDKVKEGVPIYLCWPEPDSPRVEAPARYAIQGTEARDKP